MTAKGDEALFPEKGAALVLGGTGGLGQAIVRTLSANGASVAFTYRSRREPADRLAAECSGTGGDARAYPLDLMDREATIATIDSIAAVSGGIHSVVYAAGAPLYLRYIGQIDAERMHYHLQSDVMGFFNVVQASLPYVRSAKGAYVACCSSGIEKWPLKDALSVVPKSGVMAIARGVAREEGRYGVRANIVGTGVIDAGITHEGLASGDVPQSFIDGAVQLTPLGKLGEATDIAEAVLYLVSRRSKFVTGQVLNVDGGWSI